MDRKKLTDWFAGDKERVTLQAAALITSEACKALAERGRFTLVLAGGATPIALYELLARGIPPGLMSELGLQVPAQARRSPSDPELITLPWRHTLLFQGDERHLPSSHPDSNYAMVREHLIRHVCIPPQNVFRMPVESDDPVTDAARYETSLRALFRMPEHTLPKRFPAFDLIILGLGDDGHTASLFPGNPDLLHETERWILAADAPPYAKPPVPRLTMSLPVINHAETVLFFVPGSRHELARSIRDGKHPELPAAMVKPLKRAPLWFVAG
ncbi:MAG: 6-phosphogluconolactonase [Chlorobiaceae bacterium]|nr:6-phosphogluconolactonase [Chlorobiaceae bacterium]